MADGATPTNETSDNVSDTTSATYYEHPSFLKVVSSRGDTLARCDKTEDGQWVLSFRAAGCSVEKAVDRKDAERLVKAAAMIACQN